MAVIDYLVTHHTFGPDVTPRRPTSVLFLDLPAYLAGHDRVIFIDVGAAGVPPGTIRTYTATR